MKDLPTLFVEWREDLVERALVELHSAHLEHYEKEDREVTRDRLSALCDLAHRCLAERSAEPAVAHASRIAKERFDSGYELREVQVSVNVLQEALCQRVLSSFGPEEVVHKLILVYAIFDLTKDVLAQVYVELAAGKRSDP